MSPFCFSIPRKCVHTFSQVRHIRAVHHSTNSCDIEVHPVRSICKFLFKQYCHLWFYTCFVEKRKFCNISLPLRKLQRYTNLQLRFCPRYSSLLIGILFQQRQKRIRLQQFKFLFSLKMSQIIYT